MNNINKLVGFYLLPVYLITYIYAIIVGAETESAFLQLGGFVGPLVATYLLYKALGSRFNNAGTLTKGLVLFVGAPIWLAVVLAIKYLT